MVARTSCVYLCLPRILAGFFSVLAPPLSGAPLDPLAMSLSFVAPVAPVAPAVAPAATARRAAPSADGARGAHSLALGAMCGLEPMHQAMLGDGFELIFDVLGCHWMLFDVIWRNLMLFDVTFCGTHESLHPISWWAVTRETDRVWKLVEDIWGFGSCPRGLPHFQLRNWGRDR